ncbi:unnamed protein product [Urochloa humidicola]
MEHAADVRGGWCLRGGVIPLPATVRATDASGVAVAGDSRTGGEANLLRPETNQAEIRAGNQAEISYKHKDLAASRPCGRLISATSALSVP